MAVEQKVVIRVEIDPDLGKAAAVNAALAAFDKNAKKAHRSLDKAARTLDRDFARALGKTMQMMGRFGAKLIKINLKAFGVELLAVTAGLVAMKAALATGQAIMRAWGSTLSFLKVGVAGLTAGIVGLVSTIAAANRQFSQVQLAPFVGGLQAARTAMSGMRMGSTAQMGIQNLQQLASTLSRGGVDSRNVGMLTRAFGNFSGGDVKATQGMAQAWTQMMATGNRTAVVDQMKGMGPAYKEAAKSFQSYQGNDMIGAMIRGEFTPDAMKGSLDKLDDTVMGGFKGMITTLYNQLADIGSVFLVPLRDAMNDVERILRTGLMRVTGVLQSYGLGTFMPAMIRGMEKATDFFVKLIIEDLPRFTTVMGKIADWWRDFKSGTSKFFGDLGVSMKKFSDSGDAAWEMLKNLFGSAGIGGFVSERFKTWNKLIKENRDEFELFGTRLGGAIGGIMDVITRTKDEFFIILPELNDFLKFLTDEVFPVLGDFVSQFVTAFKSALPVIRNVVSAFLPLLKVMNSLIGTMAAMPGGLGGLAVLGMGWLSMTRGGQAAAGFMRQGMTAGPTGVRPAGMGPMSSIGWGVGNRVGGARDWYRYFRADTASGPGATRSQAALAAGKASFGGMSGLGGGAMVMGAMMLGAMGGDNQIVRNMSQMMQLGGMGMMMGGMTGAKYGGLKGAGIAAGISGMMGAHQAQGRWSGAVSGGLGGGLSVAALMAMSPAGGPATMAAAGIAAAAMATYGWFKGKSAEKDRKAETGSAMGDYGFAIEDELKGVNGANITSKMKDFQKTFGQGAEAEVAFLAWARQQGFEEDDALAHKGALQKQVGEAAIREMDSFNAAVLEMADLTGMSAREITEAADAMNIALRDTAGSMRDFLMGLYADYETTTMAAGVTMFSDAINRSFGQVVFGSRFHKGAAVDEALGQSKAANNAMLEELMTTGTISNDTAASAIDAAMAQGQALGLTGYDLVEFVHKGAAGFQREANKRGVGAGAQAFTREVESFKEKTYQDFVKSQEVQQLQHMSETMGDPLETKAIRAMWEAGTIEQELARKNMEIWKAAHDAKKAETDAVIDATAALIAMANVAAAPRSAIDRSFTEDTPADDDFMVDYEATFGAGGASQPPTFLHSNGQHFTVMPDGKQIPTGPASGSGGKNWQRGPR
jgi:hypothetical protein